MHKVQKYYVKFVTNDFIMIRKDKDYRIPFGKYKHKTLNEILIIDAKYLIWLHYNTKITLTHEFFQRVLLYTNDTGEDQSYTQK